MVIMISESVVIGNAVEFLCYLGRGVGRAGFGVPPIGQSARAQPLAALRAR